MMITMDYVMNGKMTMVDLHNQVLEFHLLLELRNTTTHFLAVQLFLVKIS